MAPKNIAANRYEIDDESLQLLLRCLDQDPGLPLFTSARVWSQERQLRISRATLWRTIQKLRKIKNSN
jgi:hypothetical protein